MWYSPQASNYHVTVGDLELQILLCLPPELWDYDHVYIWLRVLGIVC